jgi:cytochrome c biogenesis protein CcmG/thiol:disulfide interchange protein DsbE
MRRPIVWISLAGALIVAAAIVAITSTDEPVADRGAGNPQPAAVDFDRVLEEAPPPLAALYAQGDRLIPGGVDELHRQLIAVRGHPAVVNAWASWCGPCRFEFPHFQEAAARVGDRVAFIGVDTDDSDDAANTFLDQLPLPYPSVTDPDRQIFDEYEVRFALPATGFYNARGELQFVKQGPYESADALEADIHRYLG